MGLQRWIGSHACRAALTAPGGSIPLESDVVIVWRGSTGSTRVLEEAGGSVLSSLLSCVVHDTALCMALVHASSAQRVVCVAARPSQAWSHAGSAQFMPPSRPCRRAW